MSWMSLALVSALLLGFYDVGKKSAVDGNAVLPTLFLCSGTSALLVLPALLSTLLAPALAHRIGWEVQALGSRGQILVLAKTSIVTASWTLSFLALKHLPISIAAPVRASGPLFTVAGAILLFGEWPTGRQWCGILLLLSSYWVFSVLGRAEGIRFSRSPWIWALFGATFLGAASSLWDKNLLQREHLPPWGMQVWFTLDNAVLQGILWATLGRRDPTPVPVPQGCVGRGPPAPVRRCGLLPRLGHPRRASVHRGVHPALQRGGQLPGGGDGLPREEPPTEGGGAGGGAGGIVVVVVTYFLPASDSPRRIWASMSRTARSRPTRIAREMMACPMLSSSRPAMLETCDTFM